MVKIVADTTSGLPLELARELGIVIIPQLVIFGEQSFRDDTELGTGAFLQKLKTSSTLPKTAAPPPPLYHPIFREAAETGETLIVVAPSAKVSGTVRSAETARQDFPKADIRIVDSLTIAGNLATLVLLANEWVKAGNEAAVIVKHLNEMIPRQRTYFLVDTLEYLKKGGRIGAARALLGELLQVKPILQVKDGEVASFDQERTKKRALARLVDIVTDQIEAGTDPHLSVMHIDAQEDAEALAGTIRSRVEIPHIPIYTLPAAIGVHAGPKALAVGFFV